MSNLPNHNNNIHNGTRSIHCKRPKQNFTDIHGDPLRPKNKDDVRLVWENWDRLAPWDTTNDKVVVVKNFIHIIKGDVSL